MAETFEQAAERLGHVLERDEDGDIDIFAYAYNYCNGPKCVNCGDIWCHHCESADGIQPCIGKDAADARDKEARRRKYEELRAEFETDAPETPQVQP